MSSVASAASSSALDAATTPAAPTSPAPLWVMDCTLRCARARCVPCAAKLLHAHGVVAANARPESCPRFVREDAAPTQSREPAPIGLYRPRQRILTVGDGDLTFTLALARALRPAGAGKRLVATSYESLETLRRIYPRCDAILDELSALNVRVAFSVDAADLGATLPARCVPQAGFDRVVWNFPCVVRGSDGAVLAQAGSGADARGSAELDANRSLIRAFCAGAARLLSPSGEVHLTHKVGLQQWSIPQLGEEATSTAAADDDDADAAPVAPALRFSGSVIFDRSAYPPYRPRKALENSSFPIVDAQTFIFASAPNHKHNSLRPHAKSAHDSADAPCVRLDHGLVADVQRLMRDGAAGVAPAREAVEPAREGREAAAAAAHAAPPAGAKRKAGKGMKKGQKRARTA